MIRAVGGGVYSVSRSQARCHPSSRRWPVPDRTAAPSIPVERGSKAGRNPYQVPAPMSSGVYASSPALVPGKHTTNMVAQTIHGAGGKSENQHAGRRSRYISAQLPRGGGPSPDTVVFDGERCNRVGADSATRAVGPTCTVHAADGQSGGSHCPREAFRAC